MSQPGRFLVRMALFLVAVAGVLAVLAGGLMDAFMANPPLNGLILGVAVIAIGMNFRQVLMLRPEVDWIEDLRRGRPVLSGDSPRLLAPLASMLGQRRDRFSLSAMAMRSVLDGISSRLDESREISRYFTGLLIFLGLLGTFWGLVQTVGAVGEVIGSLTLAGDDFGTAFESLKGGLEKPLGGMGTAFSSSLFGLGGSLIVGFLDLQAGRAQNQFYNELEEWLSTQTKLGGGHIGAGDGEGSVPAYVQALLEQTADSLDNLQRIIARGEEGRIQSTNNMRDLTEKLSTLTDQMRTEQSLMKKLAEAQLEMRPLLAKLAEASNGLDEVTQGHIRNIDYNLNRSVEEITNGRDELIREIRSEFRLLARTIAAIAEETDQQHYEQS